MTGVHYPAQLLATFKERVGLIHEEGRRVLLHHTEHKRRREVRGVQRPRRRCPEHIEGRGFSALVHGRCNREYRGDIGRVMRVCMSRPERKDRVAVRREDEEAAEHEVKGLGEQSEKP